MTGKTLPQSFRFADLSAGQAAAFELVPDDTALAKIAGTLDLLDLKKVRFRGELAPAGKRDWRLTGQLGATVVQPCVVTLEPVTTRVEAPVERMYLADYTPPNDAAEMEMPEDDSIEALPVELDLVSVLAEALALNLPDYPRKDGVDPALARAAPPGVTPLEDDDVKPFAALADLKAKLAGNGGQNED